MSKAKSEQRPLKLVRLVTVPISFKHLIRGQARYFKQAGFEVHLVSADGPELPSVLQYEQVPHYTIPFTRQITPWHDVVCCWQLYRFFKQVRPDIVHTQTPKAGLLGQLVAWWFSVPLRLHTVGGLPLMETTGPKRTLLKAIERITYSCAHVVMPNSRAMARFMIQEGLIKPDHIQILGAGSSNGINTEYFSLDQVPDSVAALRQRFEIPEESLVFIFIGRLVRDKGVVELVQAFQQLSQQHTGIHLLLVGPLEQHLDPLPEETLQAMQVHPFITTIGYVEDVRPYLKAADVLCFPSYREGFPNVPMQAGAMQLGLIVSDINGCNEIVEHEKNGWIVPVKNTAALQETMELVVQNPQKLKQMRRHVRESIVARFGQLQIWEALHRVYQNRN